jgi:hypothetical protein
MRGRWFERKGEKKNWTKEKKKSLVQLLPAAEVAVMKIRFGKFKYSSIARLSGGK